MAEQVLGGATSLALYEETTYSAKPATPSGTLLYFVSFDAQPEQDSAADETINANRYEQAPILGFRRWSGNLKVNISPENIGTLLKHTLGGNPVVTTTGLLGKVTVTNNGTGYVKDNTFAVVTGGGFTDAVFGAVTVTGSAITNIAITSGGTGYAVDDLLTIYEGTGSGAEVKVSTVSAAGAITGLTIVSGGTGYTSGATVKASTGGASLDVSSIVDNKIQKITITSTGRGYPSTGFMAVPTVTILGAGSSATATATVATSKQHAMNIANSLVTDTGGTPKKGLTFEVAYPLEAGTKYCRYRGGRISSFDFDISSSPPSATFKIEGAFEEWDTSPWDATYDDNGHTPFSIIDADIYESNTRLADIKGARVQLDNSLDTSVYALGNDGIRSMLPPGKAKVSGSLESLFTSTRLLDKATANTTTSMTLRLISGTGDGTSGNGFVSVNIENVKLKRTSVPIPGSAGLLVNFMIHGFGTPLKRGFRATVRNMLSVV
jgi:hypothetical protein